MQSEVQLRLLALQYNCLTAESKPIVDQILEEIESKHLIKKIASYGKGSPKLKEIQACLKDMDIRLENTVVIGVRGL